MKTLKNLFIIVFLGLLIIASSCRKDDNTTPGNNPDPKVVTLSVTDVTPNSAKVRGSVDDNYGLHYIIERGFFLSIEAGSPAWNSGDKISDGSGYGQFTTVFNNLTPETNYYFCAYAKTSNGQFYGETDDFTTPASPIIHTLDGVWDYGDFEITISGLGGIFSEINTGLWLSALNCGLITETSFFLMFIDKTGDNTWDCKVRWCHAANGVVDDIFWSSLGEITMSNDGTKFTLYSEVTYDGTLYTESGVFNRKQKGFDKNIIPISNKSLLNKQAICGW